MSERLDRYVSSIEESRILKKSELKESEYLTKLARDNPYSIAEKINNSPDTEKVLRNILGDKEYDRIGELNPIAQPDIQSITSIQREIYTFANIHPDTNRNGIKEKFIKGLIDSVVVENMEFALKIIESRGMILQDLITQIFTLEGLRQIADGLKTSVMGLFSGDSYKTGKSCGELGIISFGLGAGGIVLKNVGKGITQISEHISRNVNRKTPFLNQVGAVGDLPHSIFTKSAEKKGNVVGDSTKSEVYKDYPFLVAHAEFLGNLQPKDILGQGVNGIVVRHPKKPDVVVKIAKEGMVDDLAKEFTLTQDFYMALERGKRKFPGKLSDRVLIPKVSENPLHTGGYFLMEKIDGQNLNTKFYREYYQDVLGKKYTKVDLDSLTDSQFEVLMKENGLYKVSAFGLAENDFEGRLLRSALGTFYHKQLNNTELGNTLGFLEWIGYHHNDFRTNPGNIMIDTDGKVYIIDFGKSVITPINR